MDNPSIIKDILSIIPPLSCSSHKGQSGRIGVVGGCKEYTGAPYFSAISALKVGCDLAHVFCTEDSATAIKSYSPELIIHPILDSHDVIEKFASHLPSLHSLVIGPGLGRSPIVLEATRLIIELAKVKDLPIVIDADGIYMVTETPEVIHGYKKAILTPNVAEFRNLYAKMGNSQKTTENEVLELSGLLGNVTICRKGSLDVISDGNAVISCSEPGSPRRCGGQGDLLSGAMGVFNYWAHKDIPNSGRWAGGPTIFAAFAACMLTRKCNWLAFQKYHRSMLTSDMIQEIRSAFPVLFPVD